MKAYKGFNQDGTCRNFKYEEGETYEFEGTLNVGKSGFHFCKDLVLCFDYYPPKSSIFAEVEILGNVDWEMPTKHKGATDQIKIIRFIPQSEILLMFNEDRNSGNRNSGHSNSGNLNSGNWNSGDRNSGDKNSGKSNCGDKNSGNGNSGHSNSGHWNSGHWNSGHWNSGSWNSGDSNCGDKNSGNRNSGDRNSGYRNSGNRNSGDWNSGDWNSGNKNSGNWNSGSWNSGYFNSQTPDTILVFNKPCNRELWEEAKKPSFIFFVIDADNYKASWQKEFEKASADDIALLKELPNFDAEVFEEITGIKVL